MDRREKVELFKVLLQGCVYILALVGLEDILRMIASSY
jgi:hypothetical protein